MAPVVDRYELGPIGTNCYVVRTERGAAEAVVVDPGGDAATHPPRARRGWARPAPRSSSRTRTRTTSSAVADLAEATGAPVYVSEARGATCSRTRTTTTPASAIRSVAGAGALLAGGETIELAGISFEVLAVPGHSPGHLAYYADGALFSGDVLFAGSVGRTDLPAGRLGRRWSSRSASLVDRFPPETVVYSGHGPPTTLGAELARNPFLAELRA